MKMADEYPIIPFFIASIITALLFYLAYKNWRACLRNNRMAREMPQWSTIIASAKEWYVHKAGTGMRHLNFTTEITYVYRVNNKSFKIDIPEKMFKFDGRDDPKSKVDAAKQEAEAWGKAVVKSGKKTEIYYNPKNPSESSSKMLSKRSCIPIFIVVCFTSIFFLVFIMLSLFSLFVNL